MKLFIQSEEVRPEELILLTEEDPDIPYISITDSERAKDIFVKNASSQQWLTLRKDGELQACLQINKASWDSKVTGIQSAKIAYFLLKKNADQSFILHFLEAALLHAKDEGIHYLTGRFNPDSAKPMLLQQAGFQVLEGIITFFMEISKFQTDEPELPEGFDIQSVEKKDLAELKDLASKNLRGGRFHIEPIIPDLRADFLHRIWIKNAVLGQAAEKVYICRHSSREIAGFVTLKRDRTSVLYLGEPGLAVLDLLAVSSKYRGRGLGRALTQQALIWARENRFPILTVTTQISNSAAIRTYTGVGMKFFSSQFTFRKLLF